MKTVGSILFDLDGTLTDPADGIVRCIQYALETLNLSCPSPTELMSYIGPPLRESFTAICNSSDEALIEQAVKVFRERFSTVGLFENTVYTDVPQMLAELQSMSYSLFVATSKPKVYAERILQHFSLAGYFVEIFGNELDGRLDDKAEIIKELLVKHQLSSTDALMVGDRKHDIIAAKNNAVSSVGVTYGYGSKQELFDAGVDYVCDSPQEVVTLVTKIQLSRSREI